MAGIKGALWSLVASSVPVPLPGPLLLAVIPGPEQPREGWGVKAVQPLELGSLGASECPAQSTQSREVGVPGGAEDRSLTQGCFPRVPLIHSSFTQPTCLPTLAIMTSPPPNFCQSKGEKNIPS